MQDTPPAPATPPRLDLSLTELFLGFAKISVSGFGMILPWARRLIVDEKKWMTAEEFNAVAQKADNAGLGAAALLRSAALGSPGPRAVRRPPADHRALRQILGELGRVGNNLNQIARALNRGRDEDLAALEAALHAYGEMRTALLEALGKKAGADP